MHFANECENAAATLNAWLEAHAEWLYGKGAQRPLSLRRKELEFRNEHGRLYFACWGREGVQLWRVTAWAEKGGAIRLEAERRMGAEKAVLELVPRASVLEGKIAVATARLDLCARLGQLAQAASDGAELVRLNLSPGSTPAEPGPYARLVLRRHNRNIYATGPAALLEPGRTDDFLASALLWFQRQPDAVCWLLAPENLAAMVGARLALLRDAWRERIKLWAYDAAWEKLTPQPVPTLKDLWTQEIKPFKLPRQTSSSNWAEAVAAQYPGVVDVVPGKGSATLRWRGLPFARTRRVLREERVWFGIVGAPQQILNDKTQGSWDRLIAELHTHRRHDAPDKRHELFRARAEAWLETLLRQDITQLDPGLIVAPLHAQFRVVPDTARPVDLLALRRDGRLAVIELKARADRTHALQGADYWLRVEQQRRRGYLQTARLFGKKELADEPALIYLAAPMLSFHKDFAELAQMLRPEIEAFRFDLNEDWRAGVKVARRLRVN